MKKYYVTIFIVLAVIILSFVIYKLATFSMFGDPYILIISSVSSADKRYLATVSTIDAGATTAIYTRVIITDRQGNGKDKENEEHVFAIKHENNIELLWQGERSLLIKYHAEEIAVKETKWKDLTIEYQEMPPIVTP